MSRAGRESVLKRLQEYAAKALSEAKVNLSWISPDPEYVAAVQGFSRISFCPTSAGERRAFMQTLEKLLPQIKTFWRREFAGAVCFESDLPGGAGLLPGHRVVGPEPGRSGQPAAGGLPLRERCWRTWTNWLAEQGPAAVAAEVTRDIGDGAIKLWTTAQVLRLRRAEHRALPPRQLSALVCGGRGRATRDRACAAI